MFKSRRKKKQEKEQKKLALEAEAAAAAALARKPEPSIVYRPLEEIKVARDFRTSVIVPQLQDLASPFRNEDISTSPLAKQQFSSPLASRTPDRTEKETPPKDGNHQYQELAAWRALRNQNRYSNAMFGGKQRGPKMMGNRKTVHQSKPESVKISNQEVYETAICPPMKLPEKPDIDPKICPVNRAEEIEYEDEDSDIENYFFKDFAPGHEKLRSPQNRPRSKRYSARARSNKSTRQFDVFSFAQHLHDNRLSVAQPRTTNVAMTGEDERELQLLLQRTPAVPQGSVHGYPVQPIQPIQERKPITQTHFAYSEKTLQEPTINRKESQKKNPVQETSPALPPVQRFGLKPISTENNSVRKTQTTRDDRKRRDPKEDKDCQEVSGLPARDSNSTVSSSDTPKSIENFQLSPSSRLAQKPSLPHMTLLANTPEGSDREGNRALLNKKPSLLSHALNRANTVEHNNINIATIGRPIHPPSGLRNMQLSSSESSPSAFSAPRTAPLPPNSHGRNLSSTSNLTSTPSSPTQNSPTFAPYSNINYSDEARYQSALGTVTNEMSKTSINLLPAQKQKNNVHRRSMSLNNLSQTITAPQITLDKERSKIDRSPNVSSPLGPQISVSRMGRDDRGMAPSPHKPQGLFGTLRQVGINRSQPGSFRGLIRNMSTGNHQSQESVYDDGGSNDSSSESKGMSRAAMAVIHHNVINSKPAEEPALSKNQHHNMVPKSPTSPLTNQNANIAVSKGGGTRLISQLLAKTVKSRKPRKVGADSSFSGNPVISLPRSQVVRRTIIYVQPDSIPIANFLDGEDVPPLPCTLNPTLSQSKWKSATLEEKYSSDNLKTSSFSSQNPPRRPYRPGDNDRDALKNKAVDQLGSATPCLQGLELREMSDGSVEWGLVKKKGNRKSFYRPSDASPPPSVAQNTSVPPIPTRLLVEDEIEDEDEDWFDNHLLALMESTPDLSKSNAPAIPRRSPRRPQASHVSTPEHSEKSATDVYYAPTMTLPNLLHMMASNNEGELLGGKTGKSVEEELDDMMKMFASH
ncbi:hypothetical protein CLU79DRAFT_884030 [Phycomyces nitens]|nr:hypothetical protein CLU79DRAFT_884030 [Phycomyces nitens]